MIRFLLLIMVFLIVSLRLAAQFSTVEHRLPAGSEIAVSRPGFYGKAGSVYILTSDISSSRSAIFLGKDVVLDLNGYTITYADGGYTHVENAGFEQGAAGWDFSGAPGARIADAAEVHVFIGEKILSLEKGDEIVSGYVNLPEPGRSYFAMCGVTGRYYYDLKGPDSDMKVSIFVEDGQGREVRCVTSYGDTTMVSCPVIARSPRLGGGFVYAHLNNLPAGRYRVRLRAETDCLIDEVDIRPAMDVGIGIAGKSHPFGHYDHAFNNRHSAFFDYARDVKNGKLIPEIPPAEGQGSVIIRNGTIKNAAEGIMSWGVQSTAPGVRVILDNVRIETSGINSTAVDVEQATITRCTFDVSNPFIINRHGSEFYGVDLRGDRPSEVSFSEFYGGQGCLCFKGRNTSVHHNLFVNRQTVTNHYSIMAMGDSSVIFSNVFRPESGSGIEIFRKKYISIFGNEFHISAAPPSCEYADHLSTNAIRIADYGAARGARNGAYGNRVYNNRFFITGRKYARYPGFIPMASAVFYSASAGPNEVSGNEIYIKQEHPGSDAEAFALYAGNSRGGIFSGNTIVTNVTPLWIASAYGSADSLLVAGNSFRIDSNNTSEVSIVRMGSSQPARGIEFRSNRCESCELTIGANDKAHTYTVFETLIINVSDRRGKPVADAELSISDMTGKTLISGSDMQGRIVLELPVYKIEGKTKTMFSPYTLSSGGASIKATPGSTEPVSFRLKK